MVSLRCSYFVFTLSQNVSKEILLNYSFSVILYATSVIMSFDETENDCLFQCRVKVECITYKTSIQGSEYLLKCSQTNPSIPK
jgi:hypothetical protein